jgi:hypothetical protein
VGESGTAGDETVQPRGPNGEALTRARRMTYRQARPWLKRSDVRIGVMPCGTDIRWLQEDDERQSYVEHLRRAEGGDCNVAGDVLLYRITDSVKVLVVEEPY